MAVALREAAERIGVSQRRARAMIAAGQLEAEKVGGRWVVDPESLDRVAAARRRDGPPWTPLLAWAYLLYRDGDPQALDGLSRVSRHRVRQRADAPLALALDELAVLAARRATPWRCHAHPSVVDELRETGVASGLSAAEALGVGLGVRPGEHADVYLPRSRARGLIDELALSPARGAQVNAIVRAVPESAWRLDHRRIAPVLAVALDLAEHGDARSREAAERLAACVSRAHRRRETQHPQQHVRSKRHDEAHAEHVDPEHGDAASDGGHVGHVPTASLGHLLTVGLP
jgi:excisionase family DNA binding protein